MELKFRTLYASEIECRPGMISSKGLTILPYKDARCDMNILDETVGPMNWTRSHSRENANCIVSIWECFPGNVKLFANGDNRNFLCNASCKCQK